MIEFRSETRGHDFSQVFFSKSSYESHIQNTNQWKAYFMMNTMLF